MSLPAPDFTKSLDGATEKMKASMRRVGIIGYGAVGRYLARAVQTDPACKQRCARHAQSPQRRPS